jgi:hypothetical protein
MLKYTITKIERVQNARLRKKYHQKREELAEEHGLKSPTDEPEVWLFHGTRKFSPLDLINDKEGFDFRHADPSSLYAHTIKSGTTKNPVATYQMFLASVLVGKVHVCSADSKIVKPPSGFDSVGGDPSTHSSFSYIIYEFNRAYPSYLISYKDSS